MLLHKMKLHAIKKQDLLESSFYTCFGNKVSRYLKGASDLLFIMGLPSLGPWGTTFLINSHK